MDQSPQPKNQLIQSFKDRHQKSVSSLQANHKKTLDTVRKAPLAVIGTSTGHLLASGALSGVMMLAPGKLEAILPGGTEPHDHQAQAVVAAQTTESPEASAVLAQPSISKSTLSQLLMSGVPSEPRALTEKEEDEIARIIKQNLNFTATASLDGHRLNTSYGLMGYEQHLPRFPGDRIELHDEYQSTGITGNTGAWGYFAPSETAMTEETIKMEKYYFAVQTFMAPEWRQNVYQLKEWFKFRKMVAINPKTGDVVVGVVGDAGPAVWTGKQFGGSPEAMHEMKLGGGMRKGEVILFFVDDPDDTIPLGPLAFPS